LAARLDQRVRLLPHPGRERLLRRRAVRAVVAARLGPRAGGGEQQQRSEAERAGHAFTIAARRAHRQDVRMTTPRIVALVGREEDAPGRARLLAASAACGVLLR